MDPSSDPGRDEYGLPPVDVEIPDDARDLDRDVQAYHRELRAQRRRRRVHRFTRPLTRHGMVIPLVAGCLALTLLSGTLLTVLAGHQVPPPRPVRMSAAARTHSTPSRSPSPGPLPDAQVTVDGKIVSLRTLVPAVLAWVPTACACAVALRQLAAQAAQAHIGFYLVGNGAAVQQLSGLARQANQPTSQVVNDTTDAISIYQPFGLTAILADRSGNVGGVVRQLPGRDSEVVTDLRALADASSPSPSVMP